MFKSLFQVITIALTTVCAFSNPMSASSILAISGLTYGPAPPVAGQPLTITVSGLSKSNITSATISVKAKWIFWSDRQGVVCPIAAGQTAITFSVNIPSTKPSIKVSVTADVKCGGL
ncbi:hypothetical protein BC829DRAFT_404819 [Chytridium lagenaria]|nr:hypothetical protein BC829DRAFT_404819 [Chytridium lagenaria]